MMQKRLPDARYTAEEETYMRNGHCCNKCKPINSQFLSSSYHLLIICYTADEMIKVDLQSGSTSGESIWRISSNCAKDSGLSTKLANKMQSQLQVYNSSQNFIHCFFPVFFHHMWRRFSFT